VALVQLERLRRPGPAFVVIPAFRRVPNTVLTFYKSLTASTWITERYFSTPNASGVT
jgi:hypothetical protein